MNKDQLEKIKTKNGFIAALDQSGGSTPKALALYGIDNTHYETDEEMFQLVHNMRVRIMTNSSFTGERILGAILFENTMDRDVEGKPTAKYLWEEKNIIPFLKVDKGLAVEKQGVQTMKPIPGLAELLIRARDKGIFGTKMRSYIQKANSDGIARVVTQQFKIAAQILEAGLMPIIEPEVDIYSEDKEEAEKILKEEILKQLDIFNKGQVMLKLSLPSIENYYEDLVQHEKVLKVVALSGGYTREVANQKTAANKGIIASFSRALTQDLAYDQSEEEFTRSLEEAIDSIFKASST